MNGNYLTVNRYVAFLSMRTNGSNYTIQIVGSTALFNHVGDGIVISHHTEHTLRVIDYPSLTVRESPAAHVGGCVALALDPRGRYLASGGLDSIINMFDLNDWICARTITICECVNYVLTLVQRFSSSVQKCCEWLELLIRRRISGNCKCRDIHRHRMHFLVRRHF